MTSDRIDIRIAIETPDRRGLVARLCDELDRALARDERWQRDDAVVPWHASAGSFEELPARVAAAVLDEWAELGDCLAGIEFSGYLETDRGPRAWGLLTVHEGRPRERQPEIESCTVEATEGGYRLAARLRQPSTATDGADG